MNGRQRAGGVRKIKFTLWNLLQMMSMTNPLIIAPLCGFAKGGLSGLVIGLFAGVLIALASFYGLEKSSRIVFQRVDKMKSEKVQELCYALGFFGAFLWNCLAGGFALFFTERIVSRFTA